MNRHVIKWCFAACTLAVLAACNDSQGKDRNGDGLARLQLYRQQIDSIKTVARSGDLIFRNGTDNVSRAARSMNRIDTSFSHCGILQVENDSLVVYHAIGGEYNPGQRLRRDPIDSFCLPPESDRFAIYRYALSPAENDTLAAITRRYHRAGLKFDLFFNFLSDDEMYCSEFVFKCLDRSLSGALRQLITAREWPYGVSPDDLFLNERSRLVKRVDY